MRLIHAETPWRFLIRRALVYSQSHTGRVRQRIGTTGAVSCIIIGKVTGTIPTNDPNDVLTLVDSHEGPPIIGVAA